MSLTATIYSNLNCAKCRMTEKKMPGAGVVHFWELDESSQNELRLKWQREGMSSFPVVKVYDNGNLIDSWCDMRIDKVRKYEKIIE